MNLDVKAILFDFGGTLDTNGIHWSEKFWEAYSHFKINIPKEEFRNAFVYSERKIPGIIKKDFSLLETYKTQITYQLEYLIDKELLSNSDKQKTVTNLSNYCYQSVQENISKTKNVLEQLKDKFILGLVSNYYGNVKNVLTELGIAKYFKIITDSTILGIRKPDKRIFDYTISQLNILPKEVVIVGDSYKNDIAPGKLLGCKTIWLKVKGWHDNYGMESADVVIKSLEEILKII